MTDLTLGQRIAQRRKLLGLSQEAFGEKMGVSRQAISKWEADAATPEIEKLITMSKLFDVSAGWLLGTEETADPHPQDFTDAQIRAIEQIARQYRYEPTPQSTRKWPIILWAIGTALSLILSFSALKETDNIMEYNSSHINYLNNSISDLQAQINALRASTESTGAELLMEWNISMEAKPDLSGAYITFTGIPISIQPDDQARISIRRDGQEIATADCSRDGSGYTAAAELSSADGYVCYFMVIHADGNSEQQKLVHDELSHLGYAIHPHAFGCPSDYGYTASDHTLQLQFDGNSDDIFVSCPEYLPQNAAVEWADLELVLYRNETAADRLRLTNYQKDGSHLMITIPDACHFSIPNLTNGDDALLYLEGKVTVNGVTSDFRSCIIGWHKDADGLWDLGLIDKY